MPPRQQQDTAHVEQTTTDFGAAQAFQPSGGTLMMSEHPSFMPELSSVLAHPWALNVYRVEDRSAQQRILRAIRRLGRSHLTATGAQRGGEIFVIVDCDSASSVVRAKQVVMAVDRHAAVTFASQSEAALP